MGLLKDYKRNFKQFQGRFKIDFVYNDFHSKATNPGVVYLNFNYLFSMQEMDMVAFIHHEIERSIKIKNILLLKIKKLI